MLKQADCSLREQGKGQLERPAIGMEFPALELGMVGSYSQ